MIPNIKVEEGEEMDISCTATDGNPLPKVEIITIIITIIFIITVVMVIIHVQVSLILNGELLGESSLSFATNLVAADHHHDQEIVCEVALSKSLKSLLLIL